MIKPSDISIPNLIIAGAPKCGTSSLFDWLAAHPEAQGSSPKEPFFLMDSDHPLMNKKANFHKDGWGGYQEFFTGKNANPRITFEATTHYLYQQTAIEAISKLENPPFIIFLLRNPSERLFSSFVFTKNNLAGFKKELSFEDYVDIVVSNNESELKKYIDRKESLYVLQHDLRYCQYVDFLERWIDKIDKTKISIFTFDDLKNDPKMVMDAICHNVGIDEKFYENFNFVSKNPSYSIKGKKLHRIISKYRSFIPHSKAKELTKSIYYKFQNHKKKQEAINEHTREVLDAYFAPYNQRLAEMFDLNIVKWQKENAY